MSSLFSLKSRVFWVLKLSLLLSTQGLTACRGDNRSLEGSEDDFEDQMMRPVDTQGFDAQASDLHLDDLEVINAQPHDAYVTQDASIEVITPDDIDSPAILPYDPIPLVNPMIATGGVIAEIANVTPAASAPLGLTFIGPDTRKINGMFSAYHCAGYHYADTHIQGFSHTHAHGMGVVDYGGISVMPRGQWREAYQTLAGRQAPFSHEEEWSSPGYYGVTLQDDQTIVNIVATPHGAQHRYLFTEESEPVVIVDLGNNLSSTHVGESSIQVDGGDLSLFQNVQGQYSGRFGGVMHHAALRFDPPPTSIMGWVDGGEVREGALFEGTHTAVYAQFPEGTTTVDVRVALSYVDVEGAWRNLLGELPNTEFEARQAEVEEAWRSLLSRVRVRGAEVDVKRFTTAHYHSLLMPSLNSDLDGRYRGLDQEIHQADFEYYSDFSLWDTFRTLHSFYILAHPDLQLNLVRSLVRMARDGGALPRWPLAHGYTNGMVGSPATQVLAESYLKELIGWDVDAGYQSALAHASGSMPHANRKGIEEYLDLGWIPDDEFDSSVSLTLEYAWSDFSLAQWAQKMGQPESQRLLSQSQGWRNHWDPSAQFMVGRDRDGSFVWDGVPYRWNRSYVEGNAWHYLWYVPYDVEQMITVQHHGDHDGFLDRLSRYWEDVFAEEDDLLPDEFYWHGNEPVMHYAWLSSLAGHHELTVKASHWILANRYGHGPTDGLDGNDDSGTLSAWYLWAAMGVYPVAGTDFYALGAPIFDRIEIDGVDMHTTSLSLKAPMADWNMVPSHIYAGGQRLETPKLTHQMLRRGLTFIYP